MAQLTIDTQDYRDLYETMQAIYNNLKYNKKDLEFCPIDQFNKIEDKYSALEKDYNTCLEELDSIKKKLSAEIEKNRSLETIKANCLQEIEDLKAKYIELEEKYSRNKEELNKYTPDFEDPSVEFLYFCVKDGSLERTVMERNAFYFAVKRDNAYDFWYYEEKASHKKAIECLQTILEPFCEIEGEVATANTVVNRGNGLLAIENEKFVVKRKAKVGLIK